MSTWSLNFSCYSVSFLCAILFSHLTLEDGPGLWKFAQHVTTFFLLDTKEEPQPWPLSHLAPHGWGMDSSLLAISSCKSFQLQCRLPLRVTPGTFKPEHRVGSRVTGVKVCDVCLCLLIHASWATTVDPTLHSLSNPGARVETPVFFLNTAWETLVSQRCP